VNSKSTWIGAFVNPGKSTWIGASDFRGWHSNPSGNVPLYLMLDPRFKGLKCVTEHVGVVMEREFLEEYDNCVLLPLVVKVSQH
jgi:hypothetical protein